MTRRTSPGHTWLIGSLIVVLGLLAGCARSSPQQAAQNERRLASVQTAAGRIPQVVTVTVSYSSTFQQPSRVNGLVIVRAGTPQDQMQKIADQVAELVWKSDVEPLAAVGLQLHRQGQAPGTGIGPVYADTRLEQMFGPRPKG